VTGPGRSLFAAAAGIAGVTVAARVVGFGRTTVLANVLASTCLGSTYSAVNAVPNVVFEIVAGGALASLVVPVLAPSVAAGDRDATSQTVSALLTWTMVLLVPVTLLGVLVAPELVRLLLGQLDCGPQAQVVGIAMLRVFLPQVVLYGVAVVLTGVLQAHRRFLGPALAPLLSSLVVATAYLVYGARGRQGLASLPTSQQLVLSIGTTLGVAVLALSLVVPLRRCGLRVRPALAFPPGVGQQVRRLSGAGVAGLIAQQLALVVALRLAARGTTGAVVTFTVATAVFLLPWAVLAVPVATSAFPRLAAADDEEYAALAARALRAVLLLSLAGAAVLLATAVPVGRLLGQPVPGQLADAVRAFAPGLAGYGLLALLTRALYARDRGRRAATATVAGWLAVAVADAVLVLRTDLGPVTALGLGNAVGMTLAAGLLLAGVRDVAPGVLAGVARTGTAGVLGAAAVAVLVALLPEPAGRSVVVSLASGAGLAGGAVLLYGVVVAALDPAGLKALRRG